MEDQKIKRYKSKRELKAGNSTYKTLGINDVQEFYANKFVWDYVPNIIEQDYATKFDISFVKQYWIFNNIREGSRVLDIGCGSGTLNLLKSRKAYLVGTDLSEKALEQALLAGYDEVILCDSFDIPFPDNSFDFVVSLDVLGHIENEVKDVYLREWIRLLKDEGVMLHGIEADNIDYSMLHEREKQHLATDGHAGLESFDKIEERFRKYFHEVIAENCMGPCLNWYDIEKYIKTEERIGKELRDYILTFTPEQARAFNTAMLMMRELLLKDKLLGKAGGFMFIKASQKIKQSI
jgi:ubiquinone/menaquinone biosynthesis C-methylase UbiE